MTTRPGTGMLQRLPLHSHTTTEVHKITRTDGDVLRLTSHDRDIWFDNELYTATILQASSADRREAALRAGEQELYGYLDGETILSADLLTYAYRGARIETSVIDFVRPWMIYGQHTRWVRNIFRSGSRWTASVEGRTAKLNRPQAQRFGGAWHKECPYMLGGPYCKKDVSQWTYLTQVITVPSSRTQVTVSNGALPDINPSTGVAYVDQFYRDGSLEWLTASGTAGASLDSYTTTTLTDSSESWTVDEWVGSYLIALTAAGVVAGYSIITENSSTVLTFEVVTWSGTPTNYTIAASSNKSGTVSPISGYIHSTRTVDLLLPASRAIGGGEWAIIHPGCDGLISTCSSKYDNVENHGGDQHAPSGHEIIEQPDNDNT